jgi:ribosomal protein S27AE
MQVICEKCGISIEKEKSGRYYCTRCKEYTNFFNFKDKANSGVSDSSK